MKDGPASLVLSVEASNSNIPRTLITGPRKPKDAGLAPGGRIFPRLAHRPGKEKSIGGRKF